MAKSPKNAASCACNLSSSSASSLFYFPRRPNLRTQRGFQLLLLVGQQASDEGLRRDFASKGLLSLGQFFSGLGLQSRFLLA
jgi:hypothetical protein